MTIPRKHHFLPQAHIRKFKSEKGYFLYLKNQKKVIPKKSSTDIFAVRDLNSSLNDDGKIDHLKNEYEFEKKWDSKFNSHYDSIVDWILDSIENDSYSSNDIQKSIQYFFEYTLIGYQRSKKQEESFNDSVLAPYLESKELIPFIDSADLSDSEYSDEHLRLGKDSLISFIELASETMMKWKSNLKYPAPIASELDMLVPEKLVCEVYISTNERFYLPDRTGLIVKSQDTFIYNKLQINKIALIGLPLNPYVFLRIKNSETFPTAKTGIYTFNSEQVKRINSNIIASAGSQVLVGESFLAI